jgi:hypothetical protein
MFVDQNTSHDLCRLDPDAPYRPSNKKEAIVSDTVGGTVAGAGGGAVASQAGM